jgi:hypothetical protein
MGVSRLGHGETPFERDAAFGATSLPIVGPSPADRQYHPGLVGQTSIRSFLSVDSGKLLWADHMVQ